MSTNNEQEIVIAMINPNQTSRLVSVGAEYYTSSDTGVSQSYYSILAERQRNIQYYISYEYNNLYSTARTVVMFLFN